MKSFLSVFIIAIFCSIQQKNICGSYRGAHKAIVLNKDSTFFYNSGVDMYVSWASGKWKCSNDTIYFEVIPIYDTIRIVGEKERVYRSTDRIANLFTNSEDVYSAFAYQLETLDRMFYKKDRLYEVDNKGKLIKKKEKHSWYRETNNPWFEKIIEKE
ncbi:hypothetical protein [Flavobacterium soli]|uniref:hypothetical protein n=1 Tax=Flavobacterium soli TaxID=344881 RepID=UPI00047A53DF|nr:hypothetical protein [Flavobacterium soli]